MFPFPFPLHFGDKDPVLPWILSSLETLDLLTPTEWAFISALQELQLALFLGDWINSEKQINIKWENRIIFTWPTLVLNWETGLQVGRNYWNWLLPAQGYIPEPPPSPVNPLSILHVLKSPETKTINVVPINLHTTVFLPLSVSTFLWCLWRLHNQLLDLIHKWMIN